MPSRTQTDAELLVQALDLLIEATEADPVLRAQAGRLRDRYRAQLEAHLARKRDWLRTPSKTGNGVATTWSVRHWRDTVGE